MGTEIHRQSTLPRGYDNAFSLDLYPQRSFAPCCACNDMLRNYICSPDPHQAQLYPCLSVKQDHDLSLYRPITKVVVHSSLPPMLLKPLCVQRAGVPVLGLAEIVTRNRVVGSGLKYAASWPLVVCHRPHSAVSVPSRERCWCPGPLLSTRTVAGRHVFAPFPAPFPSSPFHAGELWIRARATRRQCPSVYSHSCQYQSKQSRDQ